MNYSNSMNNSKLLDSLIKTASQLPPKKTGSELFAEQILSILKRPETSLQDIALKAIKTAKANKIAQEIMQQDPDMGLGGIDEGMESGLGDSELGMDGMDEGVEPTDISAPGAGEAELPGNDPTATGGDPQSLIAQAIELLNQAKGSLGGGADGIGDLGDDLGGGLDNDLDLAEEEIGADELGAEEELGGLENEISDFGAEEEKPMMAPAQPMM